MKKFRITDHFLDMRNLLQRFSGLLVLLLCAASVQAGMDVPLVSVLDGTKGQMKKDSITRVEDAKFFDVSNTMLIRPYAVRNMVSFEINEDAPFMIQSNFTVTVRLRITTTDASSVTHTLDKDFTVKYDVDGSYAHRVTHLFENAYRVDVQILSMDSGTVNWPVSRVLRVTNQLQSFPKYHFDCNTSAVQQLFKDPLVGSDTKLDEVKVWWVPVAAADEYDLEWTYIDADALKDSVYGDPNDPDIELLFDNNASRVTVSGSTYQIPLLYDNKGILFYRVRSVQWSGDLGSEGGRVEANWSSSYTDGLGQMEFDGHEQSLNWQSTTSFAEEGKRKSVVQYYDGSLRARQTVTRDNVTGRSIVTESLYDYQGRPVIQVLPVPTLKTAISYNRNFNRAIGGDYDKSIYDTLADPSQFCEQVGIPMGTDSGASRYYSPNNPFLASGDDKYKFVPDAEGYPFTEVVYTQDNTGRVSRQSGVGSTFRIGSGRETKYFYSVPEQREMDALFGTEVGDRSHYFKTMVRDANGQYSVSYADMRGRTIATALAGDRQDTTLQDLPSKSLRWTTESLIDSNTSSIDGFVMANTRVFAVTKEGWHFFNYQLTPQVLQLEGCNTTNFCYDCLYDLQITITDDCNNQKLGGQPYDTLIRHFSIGVPDTSCSTASGFAVSFQKYLPEGTYQVTKKLSLSKSGMDYYRDSFFLKRNLCKSLEDYIKEQREILQGRNDACKPSCQGCLDSLGTWDKFWQLYRSRTGIADSDTASYLVAAKTAYANALADCNALCEAPDELEAIRLSMLSDLTPSSGQYADLDKTESPYSIFQGVNAIYKKPVIYKDGSGNPDSVFSTSLQTLQLPQQLTIQEFAASFKPTWAEALLPYHPEYCFYEKATELKASYEWDRTFSKADTYAEAKLKGYLNPTQHSGAPFSYFNGSGSPVADPLSTLLSGRFKAELESKLTSFKQNGSTNYTLWGVAAAMAGCETLDADCIGLFGSGPALDTSSTLCEADRDMAWRNFRQLYLEIKRKTIIRYLKSSCGSLSFYFLVGLGYHPHFVDAEDMNSIHEMPNPGSLQEAEAVKAEQEAKMKAAFDSNCEAYVTMWMTQLADCKLYSPDALKDTIIPRLLQVCKEGADVEHPMGSSSVKPSSTNTYRSFEEVIDAYNLSRGISANNCNAYLITAPAPYDQQPGYSQKPVPGKPDSCECELVSKYRNRYLQVSASYSSFSDFMKKVYDTEISDVALDALISLCNGDLDCQFTSAELQLPPAFQCNTGDICIDCDRFRTLEAEFRTRYPDVFPIADMTTQDSTQQSWNKLYEQFFNAKLGYAKDVSEYLAFANLCEGKWRSPGCDSLNRIVRLFAVDQQQNGPAPDCRGAFRTFFNNKYHSSFTSNQIDSVYFRTCGKGLEICGIKDSLLRWVAVYDSTRQKSYGITTSYAIPDSTYSFLPDLSADGMLRLPDAVRNIPSTDFSDITYKINDQAYCWQNGYTVETRFKFLSLPANGEILRLDLLNLNCVFEKTSNGVHMRSVSDNQGMVRNFGTGIGDTVNKLWNSSTVLDWVRLKVRITPTHYYVYFNTFLIWDSVRTGSLTNGTEVKISPVGRKGVIDWIRLSDVNGQSRYFEDYLTPDRPAVPLKMIYCPTAPTDCKPGFTSYYNTLRGTSLSYQQIDSVYMLFTGRSLNVCYMRDTLENLVKQFNRERNPTRVQVAVQARDYGAGSPYAQMTDPEQIIEDGHFHAADTLRLSDRKYWVYYHVSTPTGVFCTANGYGVELKMKSLKSTAAGGDQFYLQDAHLKFTLSNQVSGASPGMYLSGFIERVSVDTTKTIPVLPIKIDTNRYAFDNWITLKWTVTPKKYIFYYNGQYVGEVKRVTSFPLLTFNVFTNAFYGYQGAIDHVKMFNANNEEQFFEEFNSRYDRSIIKPSWICPSPPVNCQSTFVTFFNQQRGTNYNFAKIDSLYYAMTGIRLNMCGTAPQPPPANYTLCGRAKELFPQVAFQLVDNCADSSFFITSKAREHYRLYLDSLKGYFDSSYTAKCLNAYKYEQFTMRRQVSEYHYTLYYYDQSGNLVKTVPPTGVRANYDSVWLNNVATARAASNVLVPAHELPTNYRYNTLNQVVAQHSPDGGLSKFWYDRLGRLVLSQNARQRSVSATEENRQYSYTKYDDLGRITEVGQLKNLAANGGLLDTTTRTPSLLSSWMTSLSQRREQITSTVYDLPYEGFVGVVDNSQLVRQRNLRNRVSYTTYTDGWNTANYHQGTFYTYDIHGNVDTLLQDYGCGTCGVSAVENLMNQNGNRFKKISYNFDLISGKVNSVAYQKGWSDQFFHKYSYDGENRLTLVETSLDGFNWEKDARYEYYLHGPLARTIIGAQQVQGIDYAYTLQGWLKGVNSSGAKDSFDIGGDGRLSAANRFIARDAYGFALNYYGNDYKPVSTDAKAFPGYSAYLNNQFRPLYNGNISSMISTNRIFENPAMYPDSASLFFNYSYDQLNRIVGMDVFNKFKRNDNSFDALTRLDKYKERVSYDANGNILKYLRNGDGNGNAAHLRMDSLKYDYYAGTNRLRHVRDSVPTNWYGTNAADKIVDIDNQADADNYIYDSIGNLIQDKAEKITNINWNVYGKIIGISRDAGIQVPASEILYTYDASGNRISKLVVKNGRKSITWYVRDAQGNVMATYTSDTTIATPLQNFALIESERYIYGSSRVGVVTTAQPVDNGNAGPSSIIIDTGSVFLRGARMYELSNHLGNVLVTVSDKKKGIPDPITSSLISYFEPVMLSGTDYYPFGMPMRIGGDSSYRYGFNGKENDNEVKGGEGTQQDYGMRVYDNRLGRFLSVDPLQTKFPELTPYQFSHNSPIDGIDLDGLERLDYRLTFTSDGQPKLEHIGTGPKTKRFNSILWKETVTRHIRLEYNGEHYIFADGRNLANSEARGGIGGYNFAQKYYMKDFYDFINNPDPDLLQSVEEAHNSYLNELIGRTAIGLAAEAGNRSVNLSARRIFSNNSSNSSTNKQATAANGNTDAAQSNTAGITLKNTTPNVEGPGYKLSAKSTTISNGKVSMASGQSGSGNFEFVITNDGKLVIGKGHHHMSGGASTVLAAGSLKLRNGKVVAFDNSSGHYLPTVTEGKGFIDAFKKAGVDVTGANMSLYRAETTSSGTTKAVLEVSQRVP